jgi:hypothetical protein
VFDTVFSNRFHPERTILTPSPVRLQGFSVLSGICAKISQMARGWESKSVEQQQEEMAEQRKSSGAPISPSEQKRNRKKEGLLLSRGRLQRQLETATNPRHREMLEQSIAELDKQLSSL